MIRVKLVEKKRHSFINRKREGKIDDEQRDIIEKFHYGYVINLF